MEYLVHLFNTMAGSLQLTCVVVLATFAVTLIFKTSLTTNFAQGSVAALSVYVVALLLNSRGWSLTTSLFVGMAVGFAMGLFIDGVIFRYGRYVNIIGKQIITMGLVSLIAGAIPLIFGNTADIPFKLFFEGHLILNVGAREVSIPYNALFCAGLTVVVIGALFALLRYSKWGLSVRATASNIYVAGMMGINTTAITAMSWAIAGALGALAATIMAGTAPIGIYFMTKIQVNAFLAGILGGFATFSGPIFAAIIIIMGTSIIGSLNYFIPEISGWTEVITYVLVMLLILLKPMGIFGKKITRKV